MLKTTQSCKMCGGNKCKQGLGGALGEMGFLYSELTFFTSEDLHFYLGAVHWTRCCLFDLVIVTHREKFATIFPHHLQVFCCFICYYTATYDMCAFSSVHGQRNGGTRSCIDHLNLIQLKVEASFK